MVYAIETMMMARTRIGSIYMFARTLYYYISDDDLVDGFADIVNHLARLCFVLNAMWVDNGFQA